MRALRGLKKKEAYEARLMKSQPGFSISTDKSFHYL